MRKPASGAGRSAVTGPQVTCRRSGVALEQAELIIGGVGHAALDRVGMTVKEIKGGKVHVRVCKRADCLQEIDK